MTQNYDTTLADLGESGLLSQLFPLLPDGDAVLLGPGDDAAVVAAPDGRFVVTTDMLLQDVDFRLDWSSASDVGWKAAMQNLADVAAMGASPSSVVVGLVAPGETPAGWALDLMRGLVQGCSSFGAAVAGGDLSGGDAIIVSVTAFGDLGGHPPVTRFGACVGDVVAVAGESGWSAAGLDLLLAGELTGEGDVASQALARHRRPHPPVQLGRVAAAAGATAMIDASDGLLRDLGRVARASNVSIELDLSGSVLRQQADRLTALGQRLDADPWRWVLTGGEDHALAATFPADAALPGGFERIGQVVDRRDQDVVSPDRDLRTLGLGFDHYRS